MHPSFSRLALVRTGMEAGPAPGEIGVSERNLNPPYVVQTSDGAVTISTTPSVWSGLTIKEFIKLKLKPVNEAEFEKYAGTVFKRALDSHRFYVHPTDALDPTGKKEIAYYVLARPCGDETRYTFQ